MSLPSDGENQRQDQSSASGEDQAVDHASGIRLVPAVSGSGSTDRRARSRSIKQGPDAAPASPTVQRYLAWNSRLFV